MYASIAVGLDGRPVFSHHDPSNGALRFTRCPSVVCDGATTVVLDDPAAGVGLETSTTIGPDGVPVISYYDNNNIDLKVARPPVS